MSIKLRFSRTLVVLLLTAAFLLPLSGCIVAAAASAITAVALTQAAEEQGIPEGDYALTAQISEDADNVYASALRLNEEHPDVTVTYQWERSLRIDAIRDLDLVSLRMTPVDERKSQLVIEARSGDAGISNEELAWQTLTTICDDLSVRYVVLSGEERVPDGEPAVAGDVPVDDELLLAEEALLEDESALIEEAPLEEEPILAEETPLEEDSALIAEAPLDEDLGLAEQAPLPNETVVIVEPTGGNDLGLTGSTWRDNDLGPTGEGS